MKNIPKDILHEKFIVEYKRKNQICQELCCDIRTLNKYLKKYGIIRSNNVGVIDMRGKRFGRLVVKLFSHRNRFSKQIWICECDCGNVKKIDLAALKCGLTTSCGCYKVEKQWKGYEKISGTFWKKLSKSATERGYEFTITIQQAWEIYLKQNSCCALSGIPLLFSNAYSHKGHLQTASPDRINSDYGYIVDNFQWVHKTVNRIKGVLNNAELIAFCKAIYEHNRSYADQLEVEIKEINGWRKKNLLKKHH